MNEALARQIVLAGASGVLYPLCFPDWNLGFLAWVALVPLHLAIEGVTPGRAFRVGWFSGVIAFGGAMFWVTTAMHLYGKMPLVASYAVLLLLAVYLGLYVAIYTWVVGWIRRVLPALTVLAAPALWVALELLRTYFLSGLPWSLFGYTQSGWLPIIQFADHTGVYGVSFLLVLVNVALAELFVWASARRHLGRQWGLRWLAPSVAPLALIGAFLYGTSVLSHTTNAGDSTTISIGLVQPNIDQAQKWDKAYRQETLDRYARLTREVSAGVHLIIWPEAATPFFFEQEPQYRLELTSMSHKANVSILFGSPALRFYPDRRPYLLNSAYLLSPDGQIMGRYDKKHLVPFGEYIPLHSSVLFFLDKLVEGIGDFEAGRTTTILSVPVQPRLFSHFGVEPFEPKRARFGVVICYEVIFPDLVREFAEAGVDFMTTITNDAWFGPSAAPYQHFGMVVFRSVENRVAFARAANTGISGFIDSYGRILHASPIFTEQALRGTIPLTHEKTFYTMHGDVFARGCVIITALSLVIVSVMRRRAARSKVRTDA
ncbi:MAG: apolipoprotein N-acyltransferase [Nitrospiraceae bacterium]